MTMASGVKNNIKANKNKQIRFVLVILLFGYFLWVLSMQQIDFHGRKKILSQIDAQIAKQQQVSVSLQEKYDLVNSPEYIERVAREELGFARPDEIVFYDATLKKMN